ncbi:Pyrimidine-nucleoside phosphorylase [bioreactor metagenome]|uniref:Pyrimidine-nucleoside phosphorylase n=1 Tax=bioreactor metagenome TaxID=1076179 RepID=A0A645FX35_9ZZZZ
MKLAHAMIGIAEITGRRAIALISDMSQPLGNAVGNAVEVMEACSVLNDTGPYDLTSVCVELSCAMLELGDPSKTGCQVKQSIFRQIDDRKAFAKLMELIRNQGGQFHEDGRIAFKEGGGKNDFYLAERAGYIEKIDAELVGKAALALGAGREKKEDAIDYRAGILFSKKVGDEIKPGEMIALLEAADEKKIELSKKTLDEAITISDTKPKTLIRHILGKITKDSEEINY